MSNPFDTVERVRTIPPQLGLPKDGIYPDLPMADYRAWDAWGSSDLKAMRAGPPAMVPWRRANPGEDTDATRFGTACHLRILQPDLYAANYLTKPEGMTFASKEGKAWRDDPAHAGKAIVSAEVAREIEAVYAAFCSKELALDALAGAVGIETSILWTCPETGERLKGRPDWYDGRYVYDLKVSRHAGPGVAFRAYVEGWMHQAAYYRGGLRECGVRVQGARLVVIGPKPPQSLKVYCVEIKDATLDMIGFENVETVKSLQKCRVAGAWASTPDAWTKVEAPASALAELVHMQDWEES